jgi:hypothetical protein
MGSTLGDSSWHAYLVPGALEGLGDSLLLLRGWIYESRLFGKPRRCALSIAGSWGLLDIIRNLLLWPGNSAFLALVSF